METIPMEN